MGVYCDFYCGFGYCCCWMGVVTDLNAAGVYSRMVELLVLDCDPDCAGSDHCNWHCHC